MPRKRLVALVVVAVALGAAALAHRDHYESWWPSAPTRLTYCGRDFRWDRATTLTRREAERLSFGRRLHPAFREPLPVVGHQVYANAPARGGSDSACAGALFLAHGDGFAPYALQGGP